MFRRRRRGRAGSEVDCRWSAPIASRGRAQPCGGPGQAQAQVWCDLDRLGQAAPGVAARGWAAFARWLRDEERAAGDRAAGVRATGGPRNPDKAPSAPQTTAALKWAADQAATVAAGADRRCLVLGEGFAVVARRAPGLRVVSVPDTAASLRSERRRWQRLPPPVRARTSVAADPDGGAPAHAVIRNAQADGFWSAARAGRERTRMAAAAARTRPGAPLLYVGRRVPAWVEREVWNATGWAPAGAPPHRIRSAFVTRFVRSHSD